MSDARSTDAPDESNRPNEPDGVIALLTNVPNEALARQMGAYLVEQKLAACVNILGACESVYRWQGKVETAREIPLLIKTTQARYGEVAAAIIRLHPYDVPEIVVFPIDQGWPAYLGWVRSETAPALRSDPHHPPDASPS